MEDQNVAGEAQEQAAQAAPETTNVPEAPAAESAGDSAAVSDQAGSAGTGQLAQADAAPDVADTSGDTAGAPAGAHLDAPAAKGGEPDAIVITRGVSVAVITKGAERIPVQLKDQAHLDELRATHGVANVEVQS